MDIRLEKIHFSMVHNTRSLIYSTQNVDFYQEFSLKRQKYFDITHASIKWPVPNNVQPEDISTQMD